MAQEDPSAMTSGTGDEGAAPPTPAASPAVQTVDAPTVVRPARRGGLGGIVDEFRDAVAGTTSAQVYHDSEGNAYVQHPQLSHGNQWLKIAATALKGAAAGMAQGPGPEGKAKAPLAGIQAGEQIAERNRQNEQDASAEARQQNLDKFNAIKLKHDNAAAEFDLQRRQVTAQQQDLLFSQQQLDREKQLGSADLGTYKDEADLARVKQQNPDFWKHVYDNNIVAVPEFNQKGERQGIHLFLRTPGVGSQLAPTGTPIKIFTPGKTPKDPPTLTDQTPTIPMTHDQVDAYNNAALAKYNEWQKNKADEEFKASETKKNAGQTTLAYAEARKADAEAKAKAEENAGGTDDDLLNEIVAGKIVPERIGFLLGKKEGQAQLSRVAARAQAMGVPFDLSRLQAYPKLYLDYTSGKTSQVIKNLNTAFQTLDDLRGLNTVSSRIPGTKGHSAWNNKLVTASAEIANGLAKPGSTATKDEIRNVHDSLSPMLNRDAAMQKQAESLLEQYKTLRNSWIQGAPSSVYEAAMPDLSPEAKEVVRKVDPNSADKWFGSPVTDNGKPDGKIIGYTKDGKTMIPAGGVH